MSTLGRSDNVQWSVDEDRRLAKMWCANDPPSSCREIADALDKSKSAVDRRIASLGLRGHQGDRRMYEEMTGVALEPMIRPVRLSLPLPPPSRKPLPPSFTILVWSDVHFPFHSPEALSILRQIAVDLRPDVLVAAGDIFDFFELSDHRAPADVEADIQGTLDMGVEHLADMRAITGAKEAYFLGGNHEDRWARMLEKAKHDVRFRQLLKIPSIKRAFTFEEVVGFKELGYIYKPYVEASPLVIKDQLVITHGDLTNQYVSRTTLDKYGKSVLFGHMHRIQNFTRRDLKGQEAGWCIGCLCTLNPHYRVMADWHQGFAIITFHEDGLFDVEQIRIHDGRAIWRGSYYSHHPTEHTHAPAR